MNNSQASGHIPDLDLITYYSENSYSFLSRASPWIKLIGLIAIILILTIVKSVEVLVALYALLLLLYWHIGLPIRKLFDWCLLPVLFVLSLVILLMWNETGVPLFSLKFFWFSLTLTDNGLLLVVRLLLKALISMTSSLLFLMTTKYAYLSVLIYRIFPFPIDQIFLMSYRFLFITLDMVDSMIRAFKSRGGGLIKNVVRQSQIFAEIFALVFIRSYDQAERVNKAMESRGYDGTYTTSTEVPQMKPIDYAVLLVFLFVVTYLLLFHNSSISR
ncbi:Transmembrane component NikQ of energizing module of nickel ECF transporter [Methanosarcina barkeri 3]|uniref:Transmembrane component NikQ of energizing module of nickel ECF transporter n=2 Tax=Methanosarcina barkeri TaxID=2208 RepID=A0A0E3SM02_METBA|nr:Transmembrane component NikQ of energizing module of nickel ECF transporter [Methanosarcina barkeri 3]